MQRKIKKNKEVETVELKHELCCLVRLNQTLLIFKIIFLMNLSNSYEDFPYINENRPIIIKVY